jgi:hypothetical protein
MVMTCAAGHQFEIPQVVFGYPTPETFEAAERGDITLAGCTPDVPFQQDCPTCGLPAFSDPESASHWASERDAGTADVGGDRPR